MRRAIPGASWKCPRFHIQLLRMARSPGRPDTPGRLRKHKNGPNSAYEPFVDSPQGIRHPHSRRMEHSAFADSKVGAAVGSPRNSRYYFRVVTSRPVASKAKDDSRAEHQWRSESWCDQFPFFRIRNHYHYESPLHKLRQLCRNARRFGDDATCSSAGETHPERCRCNIRHRGHHHCSFGYTASD
jgi:hypothetical protein